MTWHACSNAATELVQVRRCRLLYVHDLGYERGRAIKSYSAMLSDLNRVVNSAFCLVTARQLNNTSTVDNRLLDMPFTGSKVVYGLIGLFDV